MSRSDRHVPDFHPVQSDYRIGAHYFPGWKQGDHWGWSKIAPFPERKPLLGWYDEDNPEVTDWEINNWNEWGEGHYLAPQVTDGFGYLDAVREVFTRRDNAPDHRLPAELGLGPYDAGYAAVDERKRLGGSAE